MQFARICTMRDQAGRISVTAVIMMALLLPLVLGTERVFGTLYRMGLWPQTTIADVETYFTQRIRDSSVTCREGTGGWEFTCDLVVHVRYNGTTRRSKYGVMGAWLGAVSGWDELPVDEPTPPSRDEFRRMPRVQNAARAWTS